MPRHTLSMAGPALLIWMAGLSSCASSDPNVIDRIGDDGVHEVISTAPAPLPAPHQLREEMVIGVEYGEQGEMLRQPLDYTMLEDGTYVILDGNPLQIRLYDHDGVFIREFGQQGQGPADLRQHRPAQASGVKPIGDSGEFEVWAGWPVFRQRWNLRGEMISATTMPEDHPFRNRRPNFFSRGETFYALSMLGRPLREGIIERDTFIITADWSGSQHDTLLTFNSPLMPDNLGLFIEVTGFYPLNRILPTSTGHLYVTSIEDDWVRELDSDSGDELLRFRWEHAPDSFDGARLETFRDGNLDSGINDGLAWFRERVSIMFIAEGPEGEIWVQRKQRFPRLGRVSVLTFPGEETWSTDVFSPDGEYLGRMQLPYAPRYQKMLQGQVHAIVLREGGAPTLIRYRTGR